MCVCDGGDYGIPFVVVSLRRKNPYCDCDGKKQSQRLLCFDNGASGDDIGHCY